MASQMTMVHIEIPTTGRSQMTPMHIEIVTKGRLSEYLKPENCAEAMGTESFYLAREAAAGYQQGKKKLEGQN